MRIAALLLLLCPFAAGAEPVKCVDAAGKTRYIDSTLAGQEKCTPVKGAIAVVPSQAPAPRPAPSAQRPAASKEQQAASAEEIADAQRRLDDARKALAEQQAIRQGGERNFARVQERLAPFEDDVKNAEEALESAKSRR
jgi:hypothetical protein